MDWRDSNIILGEQMNTRGHDSSRLLPSHKGVGILRPDGETQAGADVLALTVRTDFMPNEDWATICTRGRELREAAGTLTGHAAGLEPGLPPVLDHSVAKAIGNGARPASRPEVAELPEPLACVVAYLGDDLDDDGRDFVPTAELVDAFGVEPRGFAQQMSELGCRPARERITAEDGSERQVRGYHTASIRAAVSAHTDGGDVVDAELIDP